MINRLLDKIADRIDSGPGRISSFVNHHPFIVAGFMASVGIVDAIIGTPVLFFINLMYIPLYTYSISVHRYGICNSCLSAPVGSQAEADKRAWHIHFFHWFAERKMWQILAFCAVYIVTMFVVGQVFGDLVATLMNTVLWGIAGWVNWLNIMHDRLMPWCKWCNDDEFDDEDTNVPDPSSFGTRY